MHLALMEFDETTAQLGADVAAGDHTWAASTGRVLDDAVRGALRAALDRAQVELDVPVDRGAMASLLRRTAARRDASMLVTTWLNVVAAAERDWLEAAPATHPRTPSGDDSASQPDNSRSSPTAPAADQPPAPSGEPPPETSIAPVPSDPGPAEVPTGGPSEDPGEPTDLPSG